jgi:hypothetical protein
MFAVSPYYNKHWAVEYLIITDHLKCTILTHSTRYKFRCSEMSKENRLDMNHEISVTFL